MNPAELFSFRQPRWFENLIAMVCVVFVVTMGFIALAVFGGDGSWLEKAGLVAAFVSVSGGLIVGCGYAARYEQQKRAAIEARLGLLDTSSLVTLSGSPEVNEWNRGIVTGFLNKDRPGWSFAIGTVNTTTA